MPDSPSPRQNSRTNIVSLVHTAIAIVPTLLLALTNPTPEQCAAIIAMQGALSAAGFRFAADASLCCAKRRAAQQCPSPPITAMK